MEIVKFKDLLNDAVEMNREDNKNRFVFYSEGSWHIGLKLPTLVDYSVFYVIEQGAAKAIQL